MSTKVTISNGSDREIECSVLSEKVRVKLKEGGAEINSPFGGAKGHGKVEYEHQATAGNSSTAIWSGSYLKFRAEGKPVYMTISAGDNEVCKNYEVWKSANFIVSKGKHLKIAKKGLEWVDETGRDHEIELPICSHDDP